MSGASSPSEPPLYPLFLRLVGHRCLVVGGGAVAARKVAVLVEAGAVVTVVAPRLGADLDAERSIGPPWRWEERAFTEQDVDGCLLVVAATDDPAVNREVARAARGAAVLVNSADDPDGSDYVVPSVVRRGPLQLAVSTSGLAPALAADIRRRLEGEFPEEWGEVVALLGRVRSEAFARGLSEDQRRTLARELARLDIWALLAEGGLPRVQEAVTTCISRFSA